MSVMRRDIEEIKSEFIDWCINFLRVRFNLKDEYYDPNQHVNFTYESAAECIWKNYISISIEDLKNQYISGYYDGSHNCESKINY